MNIIRKDDYTVEGTFKQISIYAGIYDFIFTVSVIRMRIQPSTERRQGLHVHSPERPPVLTQAYTVIKTVLTSVQTGGRTAKPAAPVRNQSRRHTQMKE
jgi:hypothetical protein